MDKSNYGINDVENDLDKVIDVVDKTLLEPLVEGDENKKRKAENRNKAITPNDIVLKQMEIDFKTKELEEKVKLSNSKEASNLEIKRKELELKEKELKIKERELEDSRYYKEVETNLKEKELELKKKELHLHKRNIESEKAKAVGSLIEKTIQVAGNIVTAGAVYKTLIDGVQFVYSHDQEEVISKPAFDFFKTVVGFCKKP